MKQSFYFFLVLFITSIINAQINIKTDKNQLYTGERFKVELELSYPASVIIDSAFYKFDKIGEFEKISDSLINKQNSGRNIREKHSLSFTSFADSGSYYFTFPVFRYIKNKQTFELKSDSLKIMVLPLLSSQRPAYADSLIKKVSNPKDSSQFILPIKNIAKYQLSSREKWIIFWSVIGLLLATIVIYFLMKNKKTKIKPVQEIKTKKEPAHLIALRQLAVLRNEKLPDKGEYKDYAVRLSLIIREYLENRFEFNAAELTSSELKIQCRKFIDDSKTFESIDQFLDNTDLVKFAKFIPMHEDLEDYFSQAEKFIEQTKNENNRTQSLSDGGILQKN